MADVNANINIDINSSDALAGLKRLETQINSFQRSVNSGNAAAIAQQASLNRALLDGINSTGMFAARQVDAVSSASRFTTALEKNKLTLSEYTRYTASQLPGLSRIFRKEFDTMEQVATSRVKAINTQYLALGKNIDGITKAIAATPDALQRGYGTQMAVALQRQQMFNKLIDDGSTKLLNWGKNTQWAGRQLMVGLSLPMAAFGAAAASAFMELDKATTQLERVYGDLSTTSAEVERNTEAIKALGSEYTKYGIAVSETIGIGARAAATGATNETLLAATEQTLRFATLGQIDYNQALDTTISLQTAFGISNDQLAQKIDFLNAVENQTILTIEDMSLAIPRVATVVKGLGGDVEDLAVMMTAMREGGVSAENAANGLKSGLASMINPTNAASETLRGLGINLEGIVSQYRGDLMGTITAFAQELDKLSSFERQQALEKTFGKYQYARMSALFDNITSKTGQAARAMDLAGYSAEQLASIAEKELGTIAESTTVKFQASLEQLKLAIAPIGEAFLKIATPAIEVVTKIADAFNNLPEPIKNAIGVATVAIAGIGPVLLMGVGLMGNLVANIIKGIQWWRKLGATIKGNSAQFDYMTKAELDALAASEALEGSTTSLTGKLNLQAGAVRALTAEYQRFAGAAGIAGAAMGSIPARGARGRARGPMKMATGGVVPGSGSGDKIPALLEPGETVITKEASQRFGPVLAAMNAGTIPGYEGGVVRVGSEEFFDAIGMSQSSRQTQSVQRFAERALRSEIDITVDELSRVTTKFEELGDSAKSLKAAMIDVVGKENTPSMRAFNRKTGGGGERFTSQSKRFAEQGLFAGEEQFIRERLGDAIDEDLFNIDASHIEKEVVDGVKQWRPENLIPDFKGVNQTLENRMRSYNAAIEKGTISVAETAELMRAQTPELLESLSAQEIEAELERLRMGIHPVTENATRVSTSFAELDAALSREAMELNQSRTRLGTVSATGSQAEFLAASGQYRLGEGREEFFGAGGRSGARYAEASQMGRRRAEAEIAGARPILEDPKNDFYVQARDRRSPHVLAAKDAKQDAQAYIAAQRAELGRLRQAGGMSATQVATTQLLEDKRRFADRQKMLKLGMSETQIVRAERKLLERKIAAEEAKLVEARRSVTLQQQSARIAKQTNAALVAENAAAASGRGAGMMGRLGRGAGKAGMALGIASMVPFMAQNEEGQFAGMNANALGMGMAGAGMALDLVGMMKFAGAGGILGKIAAGMAAFAGPLAIATAAVTAAGVAIYAWRDSVDTAARKAADLGANLGGTSNALNKMAQMLGKQTPAQMRAQVQVGSLTETQQENFGEYQSLIESEVGQELITGLKEATSAERFKMLGDYVTSAVASGIMEYDFAEGFVKTISTQLGDAVMGKNVLSALSEFKDLASNTEGMLSIANKRLESAEKSADMRAVLAGGDVSNTQASNAIGQALQGIQDFANTTALAEQEFADGTISYSDYIDALNESTNAQNMYTKAIMFALQNSGDQGGTKQALIDQLTKMGYGDQAEGMVGFMDNAGMAAGAATKIAAAEQANAKIDQQLAQLNAQREASIGDLAKTQEIDRQISALQSSRITLDRQGNYVSGGMGNAGQILGIQGEAGNQAIADYINNLGREAQEAAQKDAYEVGSNMIAAIVQGMDPATAQKTAEQIVAPIGPAGAAVKKIYDNALTAGADAATAFEGAAVAARELNTETATRGIKSPTQYAAALGNIGGGTEVAKIDRYMQGLAEEDRQGFSTFLTKNQGRLQGEAGKNFASMSEAAQASLGAGVAGDIVNTDAWVESANKGQQASETIIKSIQDIGAAFGEDEEAKQRYIDFALRQDPADLDQVLPELTDRLQEINEKIPNEIQKFLNIDVTKPEEIMALSEKDISNLQFIGETIKNLPEEKKELAANVAYQENGKPKNPKVFLADLQKQNAAFEKLKSKKIEVKKKAMFDLITLRDGKPADAKAIDEAVAFLEEKYGKKVVKNLPPTEFNKAVTATYDASQMRKQAKDLRASAAELSKIPGLSGAASQLMNEAAALEASANKMEEDAASAVAAGAGVATSGESDGGGGGGDKADPFKDFKTRIVDQIKKFADAGVTLKNLMKAKYDFFNILKMSKGIDDKIRKAGLSPLIAEQLMGMDPTEANKILGKLTGKNGKLTAEGRGLQDRMIAGSISGTMSEAQTRAATAGQQQRVTADLIGRGASSQAISAIAGDPTRAAEYATLLDKVAKGGSKAEKAIKQYIAQLEKANIAEQAAASATEKAVEVAERRRRISFINTARAGGQDQGLIEYIAGDAGLMAEYTEAVKKGDVAVQAFFTKAREQLKQMQMEAYSMNPFDYIAQQANEAMDAIRAQFAPDQFRLEDESAAAFESSYGISKDAAQELIEKNNILISQYEQQVNEYERMNAQEQRLIQEHEREKKQWQDKIDNAQDYIDGWQRSIDLLNKQVSERNHQADLLNHELDLMSRAEEQINETYDKRVKALDEVEAVNNRILESQRSQLDISRSLSTGDVYAAAAAAQQMKEQQAQQAATDARDALTAARDAQVQGLRSSGGMTRDQIEEQLWQINQQNYQTSLEIYALEDKIYAKNQEIYAYKIEIDKIDNAIKEHTDKIWTNNGEILRIQKDLISPLQDANAKWTDRLKTSDLQLAYDKDHLMYQGKTLEQYEKANERMNAHLKQLDGARVLAEGIYDTWLGVGQAIADANRTAKENLSYAAKGDFSKITGIDYTQFMAEDGTFDFGAFEAEVDKIRQSGINSALNTGSASLNTGITGQQGMMAFARGGVVGQGSRDSVSAKLTPGEFVVRKSMVNKYGQAMFEKINQGAFDLPRYSVENSPTVRPISVSSMSAPVYNNNYSINVPVNQPNASADEIAYKVMTKIKSVDNANIRRVNGY